MTNGEPGFPRSPDISYPRFINHVPLSLISGHDTNPGVVRSLFSPTDTIRELAIARSFTNSDIYQLMNEGPTLGNLAYLTARELEDEGSLIDPRLLRSTAAALSNARDHIREQYDVVEHNRDGFALDSNFIQAAVNYILTPGFVELLGTGSEVRDKVDEIISHVSAFGYIGKANPGTRMQVGDLPPVFPTNDHGSISFISPQNKIFPKKMSQEGKINYLVPMLYDMKTEFRQDLYPEERDNHFYTYCPTADGAAWAVFVRMNKNAVFNDIHPDKAQYLLEHAKGFELRDVDNVGRPLEAHAQLFRVPIDDARYIAENPTIFRGFLAMASPGTDRPKGRSFRSPGLRPESSKSATVIDWNIIQPILRHDHESVLRSGISEVWSQAAQTYDYYPAQAA